LHRSKSIEEDQVSVTLSRRKGFAFSLQTWLVM
jgi:hypothetical protein